MRILINQRPFAEPFQQMDRVGVAFPAYNEERNVEAVVKAALEVGVGSVVCVNDCSRDGTGAITDRLAEDARVEAVHHEVNQGKQAAVKHGLQALLRRPETEIFAVLDADMQNDAALLTRLCGHVDAYDVVIGRRGRGDMPLVNRIANTLANTPYKLIAGIAIRDIQSGYRVYTREAAQYLADNLTVRGRYTLEHTSMLLLGKLAVERERDLHIAEVDIPYSYAGAVSRIRLRDNLQLTWASLCHAVGLARLRRHGGRR